jgi:hypothetical protein
MNQTAPTTTTRSDDARQVLIWHPEKDDTQIVPSAEQAAELLKVSPDAVVAGIESGELVNGRFVDWKA